jgi:hypothetical protein
MTIVRNVALHSLLALALFPTVTAAAVNQEPRVQIWQFQDEEPLYAASLEPTIQSVRWRDGDLEVLFAQAAPCGHWMPVDPVWKVSKLQVVLAFNWKARFPDTPAPTSLCKKFVRAWVFGVPRGEYKVAFAAEVPRFSQQEGKVFSGQRRR